MGIRQKLKQKKAQTGKTLAGRLIGKLTGTYKSLPKDSQTASGLQGVSSGTNLANFQKSASIPVGGSTLSKITGGTLGGKNNMISTTTKSGATTTKIGASSGLKAASITASLGGSREQVEQAYKTGKPIRSTSMISKPGMDSSTFNQTISDLSKTFSDATAPTSASNISPTLGSSPMGGGMPDVGTTYGDISENLSYLAGDKEIAKIIEDNMNRELQMIEQQTGQKLGILGDMFGKQKSIEEIRQEQEEKYGVDFKQMMAERKGVQAELSSINQDYLKVREGMEQQINTITSSPYGTMDFLNNQIAQIERNAAPRLNYLSGLANIKSAELAAINEDWELADKYIQRAVDDSVADQENAIRRGQAYLELYSDTFDRIGKTYKDAYLTALDMAKEKVAYDREKNLIAYKYELENKYNGGVSTGGEYGSSIYDFSISEELKAGATPEEAANLVRINEDLSPKEAAIVLRRARKLSKTIKPQVAETATGELKPKTPFVGKTPAGAFGRTAFGVFAPWSIFNTDDTNKKINDIAKWFFKTPIE